MKKFLSIIAVISILSGFGIYKAKEIENTPRKIAFLGDSITELGWMDENGYVRQIVRGLENQGLKIEPIPAGISGHNSFDVVNRIDNDVINHKPNTMFLMIGVNDQWINGSREDYKKNIETLLNKSKENNIEVILLNITPTSENLEFEYNKEIDIRNKMLFDIAKERKLVYVDGNSALKEEIKKKQNPDELVVTTDDLHLNEKGNTILANKALEGYLNKHKFLWFIL